MSSHPFHLGHPLPPCLTCGTCCFSDLESYVEVSGDDYKRLGDDAESFVEFLGHRAYMKMHQGHCAALLIQDQTQEFFCQVYEKRPRICRDLERGSPQCLGELSTKFHRPIQAMKDLIDSIGEQTTPSENFNREA